MTVNPHEVCFLGMGSSALCYYRVVLPAMYMGADWLGYMGEPPKLGVATGLVRNPDTGMPETRVPELLSGRYKIVVVQQASGGRWVKLIEALQERGIKVLYEIDDYLHGIPNEPDHMNKDNFTQEVLGQIEWPMKRADGVIVSTDYLKSQYRHRNKNVYVCRNGIDLARYDLERPKRPTVNIGWAGGTGHGPAAVPWFAHIGGIMRLKPNVCFISIGRPDFANAFAQHFGPERAIGTPWAAVEQYPAAMSMMDIALAPAGRSTWWRGKSDLRWLEASALGIPVIADPMNYSEIETGVTGLHAHSPEEAAEHMLTLVDNSVLREKIGDQAREYVREHRGMDTMVKQWEDVFEDVLTQ